MELLIKAKQIAQKLINRQQYSFNNELIKVHFDIEQFKEDNQAITILIELLSDDMKAGYVSSKDANIASSFLLRTAQRKSQEFKSIENKVASLKQRKKKQNE